MTHDSGAGSARRESERRAQLWRAGPAGRFAYLVAIFAAAGGIMGAAIRFLDTKTPERAAQVGPVIAGIGGALGAIALITSQVAASRGEPRGSVYWTGVGFAVVGIACAALTLSVHR